MTKEIKLNISNENIKDEKKNLKYLQTQKFEQKLKKLKKKLKNKKIVLYGAGAFLEVINKYYDLTELNIIGITDKKYFSNNYDNYFLGYKIFSINELEKLNPDIILVSTKFYIDIINDLVYNNLKGKKIKVKPLLEKNIWTILKEIWC